MIDQTTLEISLPEQIGSDEGAELETYVLEKTEYKDIKTCFGC